MTSLPPSRPEPVPPMSAEEVAGLRQLIASQAFYDGQYRVRYDEWRLGQDARIAREAKESAAIREFPRLLSIAADHAAQSDLIARLKVENEGLEARQLARWENATDQWTANVDGAHPLKTGRHDLYATALDMIHARHGKYEIVSLITWLLLRADSYRAALTEIACFDDEGAERTLRSSGSYSSFDEPGSVQIARAALQPDTRTSGAETGGDDAHS